MTEAIRNGRKIDDLVSRCPFCRGLPPRTDEEQAALFTKLVERGNGKATNGVAIFHATGQLGFKIDTAKTMELFLKSGELGCAIGYLNLADSYYHGKYTGVNIKKAKHYFELAAMLGSVKARYKLTMIEGAAGNKARAFKHILVAARSGDDMSMSEVTEGFKLGMLTKDQYADALRTYQQRSDEMKSVQRDVANRFKAFMADKHDA